ncbi:hypothetical protein NC651_004941 [Populus alba x Populus x berolinensis]|nr:hypothetical protein NC651_004941 [Populus alba x Populus x berolinensis]
MSAEIYTGIILFKDGDGSSCDRKRRHLGLLSLYQTEEESYHLCEILRCVNRDFSQTFQNRVKTSPSFENRGWLCGSQGRRRF